MPIFAEPVISTPCGPLVLSVAADSQVAVSYVVRQDMNFRGIVDEHDRLVRADARWAGVVSFGAAEPCGPFEMTIALPESGRGPWSCGEFLTARQFTQGDLELFIGGGDEDFFSREIAAGRLPDRWRDAFPLGSIAPRFGVVDGGGASLSLLTSGENGIGWRFPGLGAGETASLPFIVSWAHGYLAGPSASAAIEITAAESAPSEQRHRARNAPLHSKYRK